MASEIIIIPLTDIKTRDMTQLEREGYTLHMESREGLCYLER